MNADLNLDLKKVLSKFKKQWPRVSKHTPFAAIMVILLVFLFVVWHIRGLVTAEPSQSDLNQAQYSTNIPKIDQAAVNQIQSLEKSSPAVHALFNNARNNPFNE